jgi:hypothetical protein
MGGDFLTQAEGMELITGGYATVDMSNVDEDKAFVTLTESGKTLAFAKGGEAPEAPAPAFDPAPFKAAVAAQTAATAFVLRENIPMPGKRRGKRGGSAYPIETMEVGQSFHIPVTASNLEPAMRIASSLSNARIKFAVETGEDETVEVKVYAKGPDGKPVKDANGKRVVLSTNVGTRKKMVNTRDWSVATVDASDPDGVGARVWRTK